MNVRNKNRGSIQNLHGRKGWDWLAAIAISQSIRQTLLHVAQHSVEFNPARKVSVSPFPQGSAVNMSPSDPKNLPLFSPIRNFYASCSSFSPIRNLSASSCCCCSPLLSFARSPAVSLIHRSIHGGEAFQVRDPRRRCCCCKIRTSIHRFLPFFLK